MDINIGDIVFQVIVLLMALSVHESAHALIAYRVGDPTAKMLGRITLNPVKHIDPIGTVLLPIIGLVSGAGIFGWAKPCPVDPRNFKHEVRDDILVTVAGPVSNLILVAVATLALALICVISPLGRSIVHNLAAGYMIDTQSILLPTVWFLYTMVSMNMLLAIFNLLPIPPLDGSHVVRHVLPGPVREIYDNIGIFGFILIFMFAGRLIRPVVGSAMHVMDNILRSL